jgi:hypothetical protein
VTARRELPPVDDGISPRFIERSWGVPPAFFTASHGLVNSTSSTMWVARNAIFFPLSC